MPTETATAPFAGETIALAHSSTAPIIDISRFMFSLLHCIGRSEAGFIR
jgi:hypothetical protein